VYTEEQLKQKLKEFRELPSETEWLEFKAARSSFHSDDLGKYFSALSNEANLKSKHSAWLIFGVSDKLPRDIIGTNYRKSGKRCLESLKHEVAQHANGITFQEIYELNLLQGRVLMFQIPAAPAGMPTNWKGHYFGRDGESLVPLSLQELESIRNQATQHDWSAEICPEATIQDLHEDALRIARDKFLAKHKRFQPEAADWSGETFLDKARLTRKGKITRSALLLLGKPESVHHLTPHPAQITWKLDTEEKAYEHFGPPFLLTVEDLFNRIRNVKFRFHPFNRLIPVELTKYEVKTVLEALNNCIAHQDYTRNARIVVTEKVDKLTLQNIGGFYDGTVEDYVLRERTPDRYRNPFLAQAMVSLDMIDTMGMGIRRMFLEQRKRYFPMPEYDLEDQNHVRITIYGKLIDENYSRILMEEQDLSLADVILLDRIQKNQSVERTLLKDLRRRKLVEGRYPNVYVSAKIAKTTGKEVEYTKHRAFDNQYYKDLVISFLEQYKQGYSKDFRSLLTDKLSDTLSDKQKKDKVRNLLQELVREEKIQNAGGRGLGARWALKKGH